MGREYRLDRGFVEVSDKALTDSQCKILAAIRYLIQHDKMFWNSNAKLIKGPGIFPRGTKSPVLQLAGIDFESELFEAMQKAGLEYSNEQWIPKKSKK